MRTQQMRASAHEIETVEWARENNTTTDDANTQKFVRALERVEIAMENRGAQENAKKRGDQ